MKNGEKKIGSVPTKEELYEVLCVRHGREVQEKLSRAKVAIAGLGGLGSNVAMQLARIGVGHLHLLDFDCVDLTNLNRQHYFIRHLGRPKTEVLKEQILELNPYLDIRTDFVTITEENLEELFGEESIVCEAFDIPENKAMLVNGILEKFPDITLVSASGMAGFGESNKIHTRKVTSHFYLCGDESTEIAPGRGLMAPRVAICASHEANLIVELILR